MDKKAFREARKEEGLELKAWWYRELITTRSPLLERMTLFWHNHFTSSLQKVKWPPFLYQQNVLFRIHAVGSFRTLLHAVAKNPAMLLYLDTQTNHREHPNENFARELFELFTLGEGHYTETRHQAGGTSLYRMASRSSHRRVPGRAAHGTTMGGKRSSASPVISTGMTSYPLTLDQPRWPVIWSGSCGVNLFRTRLIRWRSTASPVSFRQKNYNIASLLNDLFLTPQFWASENRACLIKSPVELTVGTARLFNLPIEDRCNSSGTGAGWDRICLIPPM